ncbi:GGDEF domain-containing protein [Geodermatophilus nigrescens]
MSTRALLQPRDERSAAVVSSVLFVAGAVLLLAYLLVEPTPPTSSSGPVVAWTLLAGLLAFAGLPRVVPLARLTRCCVWPTLPVVGVAAIGGLVAVYPDAENIAHPLLALPVLFAASQLSGPVAAAVTAMAILVDGAFLLAIEDRAEALVDLLYIGVVLVVIAVLLARAVAAQEVLVRALQHQAAVDALTGLATRRALDEALASALTTVPTATGADRGTALVLVDVDQFKSINDAHGHPVGDDALVHLAGILTSTVRTGDPVIGRLGGDELAVVLRDCPVEVALRRAEDLVLAVRATPLFLTDGRALPLSVSVGVAHAPEHAAGLRGLYAAADAALYRAKRAGRDQAQTAPRGPAGFPGAAGAALLTAHG